MLNIRFSSQFKKDYKRALKRGCTREEMENAIRLIANGNPLPSKFHDHALQGKWKNHRDCHIRPDWILIYQIKND